MAKEISEPQLPILEVECRRCEGNGDYVNRRCTVVTCEECNGTGHIPTAAGRQLLALVEHNFHLHFAKYTKHISQYDQAPRNE